jgi:calcineurin-like phosphoesterase family protein
MILKIEKDIKGIFPNIWICSDPHYNHKNICRGTTNWRTTDNEIPVDQTRDFDTIERMNQSIVDGINWNVGQDDVLICLGDWSFGGFEFIQQFRDRIVCKNVHLVLGNHDHHIERNRENIQSIFNSVCEYLRIVVMEPVKKNESMRHEFVCMHYPIQSWDGLNKGIIHLHGHVHLPNERKFGQGKKMDVGFDGHPEFRPYNLLREIVPIMKKREMLSDMPNDHHLERLLNADK